jgi:gliding motility-associated-like protein
MRKLFLVVLTCALVQFSFAQDFSNKGKEFYITYPTHIDGTTSFMGIYITSDQNATGNISVNGDNIPFTVIANQIVYKFLGSSGTVDAPNNNVYLNTQRGIETNRAIKVVADRPVVVYAHIIKSARSGASLILPVTVWGKEYTVPNYRNQGGSNSFGTISVVAAKPNTEIEITPTATTRDNTYPSGTPFTVTLPNVGDVYQVQFANGADISGTKVRSIASTGGSGCNPIAVFSSTSWSGIGCNAASGGDNLYQQLFPTSSWGKSFLTAPLKKDPSNPSDNNRDIIRVFVKNPATVVTLTSNGTTSTLTGLQPAGYYEFNSSVPTFISADDQIQVVQYITSQTCSSPSTNSDPEMIILNAVEQTINNITVFSAHQNFVPTGQSNVNTHYINVIIKSSVAGSFRINNTLPTGNFIAIPGTAYSYLKENVTSRAASNPVFNLTADSAFSAIAYGFGNVESYGYNAGTNVKDLYQFITTFNPLSVEQGTNVCKGTPFKFRVTLPYQPSYINWNFNGLFPNVNTMSPVADSTYMLNGRTLRRFSLPMDYTANMAGSYPVVITTDNPSPDGCSGTQEINFDLNVFDPPVANFTFMHSGCITDSVFFEENSTTLKPVYKWFWDMGDMTTDSVKRPRKLYLTPGTKNVKLKVLTTVGCFSEEVIKPVNISPKPAANFTFPTNICEKVSTTFTNTTTIAAGGTINSWEWNFGDATGDFTFSTGSPVTHTFNSAGNFTVRLIVKTTTGCRDTISKLVTIKPKPFASFLLPGNVCLPKPSGVFTNNTTIADGTLATVTYVWNFGDATANSTQTNPTHVFSGVGPFNVTLTATSNAGCVDDTIIPITTIYPKPTVGIIAGTFQCINVGTTFNSTATTGAGSVITDYFWDLGTGSFISNGTVNPLVTSFATPGIKTIRHFVKTDKGCFSDTISISFNVVPPPVPLITVGAIRCANNAVTFTNASTANATSITTIKFTPGDGSPVQTINNPTTFTHTYATAGTYNASFEVINSNSCVALTTATVVVNPKPVPDFTIPNICLPIGAATFTNTTTLNGVANNTLTYSWNFGDAGATGANPNTSTLVNATHNFITTGPYNVKLIATSTSGCIDSITKPVNTIYAAPQANFTVPAEVCFKSVTNLTDQSLPLAGNIQSWNWDFGNGQTSTQQNPSLTYANSNNYNITLTITTTNGCVSSVTTKPHLVMTNPVPNFTIGNPACLNQTVNFDDITTPTNAGNINQFIWGFGNGSTQNTTNSNIVTSTYTTTGNYSAYLLVKTDKGCTSDTVFKPVIVNPLPEVKPTLPEVCLLDPTALFFDNSTIADGTEAAFTYLWNFGDVNATPINPNTSTLKNPSHRYIATGPYNVSLTVTSGVGCSVKKDTSFFVNGTIPNGVITVNNNNNLCSNRKVEVVNNSTVDVGNITRIIIYWDFLNNPSLQTIDEDPAPGKNYQYTYPQFGMPATRNVTVRVRAFSGGVCENVRDQVITLKAAPIVQFNPIPSICLEQNQVQITQALETLGVPGTGVFSGTKMPATAPYATGVINSTGSFNPNNAGTGLYFIRYVFNANNGCTDTGYQSVSVNPTPSIDLGPNIVVLEGGTRILNPISVSSNVVSYLWTPSTYLSATNIRNPNTTPVDDITYTLRVTSDSGCVNKDEIFVKVLKSPEVPNAFSPNGDGINDTWEIKYLDSYPGATIEIYNRYGQLIFNTTNYKAWDGKANGIDVPFGTYYYIVNPKNGRGILRGSITIIR